MVTNISIWIIAYVLGSIPFGVLLARTQRIDLRVHGSGNTGATNVARILGRKLGALTLLGDSFKGWLAVSLASWVLSDAVAIAFAALMAFLGHLFPIFLKFKGGKGVATLSGGLIALNPLIPLIAGVAMTKRTFIAESKDGRDWGNFRQLTTIFGDTPGELIQLPDGRVVFLYCHRYAPHHGLYARISHDEGRTWRPEMVGLRNIHYGYSSSTVLNNGTIVSMIGGETIQAVRWRLPGEL